MLSQQISHGLEAVDEQLRWATSKTDVDVLGQASRHTISAGGKRLRPQIGMLAYLASGGHELADVIPMFAAIELVHTATLVHDDINDHSLTRRGAASVHARWGRTFALLTGDYLFAKVYEMMAPYGAAYNVIMADACVRLVEGETLQAAAAKSGEIDRETYKKIISRKTASLFEATARMGSMYAGASDQTVEALSQYAYYVGLVFQIVDDILDIVGDSETLGKPVGVDVAHGMGALVAHAPANGNGLSRATSATIDDPVASMMERLRDSGAVEIARLQAAEMAQRARQSLTLLPSSPAREALLALVDRVMERDH